MSNKAYFERDVKNRVDELDKQEDMMCIGLLSLSSYSSSARATMLTQHLTQALVPDHPEIPAVCTGYEQMFGEFSVSYKRAESELKVIKKIEKFPGYVYTLLVYDAEKNYYDIITRNEANDMAEHYGYKYNNEVIDKYKEGDIIKKNTVLYRPPAIDEDGNFMYGVNGKVVYVVSQETIEDAVVVSESFAKKLSTTKVDDCYVQINDNDIPLNLYGDKETYQAFPYVGEKTKDSILCGMRRRNKSFDQLNLKNNNLRKVAPNDSIFQFIGDYKVIDIDIWSNKEYDEIPDMPAYKQVKEHYRMALQYYTEIYETFGELIAKKKKYSPELSRLYAKARDYLDPSCKYTEDEKPFSNIIMKFTLTKSCNLIRGCKISGRY